METEILDLIILGTGPAGLTASIYASRYGLKHIILGQVPGGMASEAPEIHNWPGEIAISGYNLAQKMVKHVEHLGGVIAQDKAIGVEKKDGYFSVLTQSQTEYRAKTVILAMGTERKKLNIPGEKELFGHGVCYCATCDGPLYKNKTIAVVGGGNAGVGAALYLVNLVSKLYLITNENELRAEDRLQQLIRDHASKIEVILGHCIKELRGEGKLRELILDREYNGQTNFAIDGIFIEIGSAPPKELIEKIGVKTDAEGYIQIGPDGAASIEGIFAAGDIANGENNFKQIITASASGAIAAHSAQNFLKGRKQ